MTETKSKNQETVYPSIFNDVIGPVMRGPSSSHCAAAVRIGRMARDLMGGNLDEVLIKFDRHGSLATTHSSQGSDMGLFGGLLGWEATDERLPNAHQRIQEVGINIRIEIIDEPAPHPNTYRMRLINSTETHEITAVSTGGGMVELIEIDGATVSIKGDFYETLVYLDPDGGEVVGCPEEIIGVDDLLLLDGDGVQIIGIKTQKPLDRGIISEISDRYPVSQIKQISPVLPVLSRKALSVPFITCEGMFRYNSDRDLDLWELAVHYESARGNLPPEMVNQKMREIIGIMENSIEQGLEGTEYPDRILGYQSGQFHSRMIKKGLLDGGILNQIILYVTAMMEMKSAMGLIVAAPTAGACGCLPGACIGAARALGLSEDDISRGMLAAGMIGVFIGANATFAAEVGGCQAECGAGSGMAAAALVSLANGTLQQAIGAASMALQNTLGLICDPVANRVEVPCLGRNVMAASNALACANMALADYDPVIPLDEVIHTMYQVGRDIPVELRCTALGGLSITPTSRKIEQRLINL
jgi:L-serine dehydratase